MTVAITTAMTTVFYGSIWVGGLIAVLSPLVSPAERYFAGHPIAVVATIMFFAALAMLMVRAAQTVHAMNQLASIRDADLAPPSAPSNSPGDRWLAENDAGHVAGRWLDVLETLPARLQSSLLVSRLNEILERQSVRGGGADLADDLREMADRDADSAHDSLGLVRIIVWAIPMLGFLGTVIGITQTLGGLDFTNGTAAVDSLKTGLNIAFDTTALGLVLSVVAIFLQHPVERHEAAMLAEVDHRVGRLVSQHLPSDDTSDNQTVLIADLCQGVQAAVAQSLDDQARLWRDTIDEARSQWQSHHELNNQAFVDAFEVSLIPALRSQATAVSGQQQQQEAVVEKLAQSIQSLTTRLDEHHDAIQDGPTITDAMRVLARAVDHLTGHLASQAAAPTISHPVPSEQRRAA